MSPDLLTRLQNHLAVVWPEQAVARLAACTPMATGWENEMYRLDLQDGRQAALRLYPGEGAERKLKRESHGMRALYELGYPVPQVYGAETDAAPLGKPFMLMEFVAGEVMMDAWLRRDSAGQAAMLQNFVRLLAELHQLDVRPLRRADDAYSDRFAEGDAYAYLDLELDQLAGNLERLPVAGLLPVLAWLQAGREQVSGPRAAVAHWDFHPNNVLLRADDTPVVIDWTQVRLSDPRFDLAWTLMLTSSHVGAWLADQFLEGYQSIMGEVNSLEWFQAYCGLKRLHTVTVMFTLGPERLGMRPEARQTIIELKPAFGIVYEQLLAITGIHVPEIEQMLSA